MNVDEILQGTPSAGERAAEPERRGRGRLAGAKAPAVGGWPQVSLLPAELRNEASQRRGRLSVVVYVAVVGLVVAGGVTLATGAATSSHARLESEVAEAQALQGRVGRFADVEALQNELALAASAERVGSSTAIDWQRRIGDIEAVKPSEFTVDSVTTTSASPVADFPQGTSPLEGERVATVIMTASSASIEHLPAWLRALPKIPDVVDAAPNVTTGEDGYAVTLTIHLNEKAYVTPLTKDGAR